MEVGRFALGRTGKKLPAFLNWIGAIGWDVVNNTLSAAALVALAVGFGVHAPFWIMLAILVGIQMLIGIYGHHIIQDTAKYTGVLLGILFIVIGLIAMHNVVPATAATKAVQLKDVLAAFLLVTVFNYAGWTTYTADYTRYLPKNTSSRAIFFGIFLALFVSTVLLAIFGYMTAQAVTDQTPEGVMRTLESLTGHFSPLVLLLIGLSAIPANAINDNSAAYCLISSGFKFSRPTSAVFGAIVGFFVCLVADKSFVEYFENFLFLFGHWIGPWAAIILLHWFMVGKHEQKTPSGLTMGALIFCGVSVVSIALFSATDLYTAPMAKVLGGLDVGPYVGFVVAGLLYWLFLRFSSKKA